MSKNFALIGGDLRLVNLAKMLANDKNKVYVYGMDKIEEIKDIPNLFNTKSIEEAINNADFIIGPLPFSKDNKNLNAPFSNNEISIKNCLEKNNNKTFIAGNFSNNVKEIIKEKNIKYVDLMEQEELVILNALSTAEGAIQIAMENTNKLLHGSKVLILGFGRISKILANKLKALSVDVTCAARKKEDFSWMKCYGYKITNINFLKEDLGQYDIIFNTVPHLILTKERIEYVKKDCVLIDLASKPGGIDKETKFIWALALPGKVAPVTSAEFMKETIYNIIMEG